MQPNKTGLDGLSMLPVGRTRLMDIQIADINRRSIASVIHRVLLYSLVSNRHVESELLTDYVGSTSLPHGNPV